MSEIPIAYSWPSTLPLPADSFEGTPRAAIASSSIEYGHPEYRNRFSQTYVLLEVTWMFTDGQLSTFENFYQDSLGNGTALFSIELRYPFGTELTTWVVRFSGDYQIDRKDGMWAVSGSIDLISQLTLGT